jgi:general stress protein 26
MNPRSVFILCLFTACFFVQTIDAQSSIPRDTIMLAGREIIGQTTYCALATVDSTGQPQVRTMNPFPVNEELIIWFATSRTSRKVKEIHKNPRVSVYWSDHVHSNGYVCITGVAEIIDDKKILMEKKRDYWKSIPGWEDQFVLIRIVPETMTVVNYKHNISSDPQTFGAPTITF